MNENIADIVYPVVDYGLSLRAKFNAGEAVDVDLEQARLQAMLLSEEESQIHSGFGREVSAKVDSFEDGQRLGSNFLGARYALVCWLDEMFTLNEHSSHLWTERKLEGRLYGTNDRAWKFWEQARLAQVRSDSSELEVFFLCVNLGFRGDRRDRPDELRSWNNQAKLRLGRVEELAFPFSTEVPSRSIPLLNGESRFRSMALTCWAALLIIIPLISFSLMRKFGG
ncbi:MAG: DotU family type IV/VI secretion system protein [Mariniblastus sp.]